MAGKVQVIIEIVKEDYDMIMRGTAPGYPLTEEVRDGKLLPEEHGRLIDADEVISIMFSYMSDKNKNHEAKYVMSVAKAIVENALTIVEANKEVIK